MVYSSQNVNRLEIQEEPIFQFKSESRKKKKSHLKSRQAGGLLLFMAGTAILFYSGLQPIR